MTMPLSRETVLPQTAPRCVARALYDNMADAPDELAFRRGDVLTVLEQNTGGSEGWWLCSLRGRQGICPGNRLRLVAGVYDTGGAPPSPPRTPVPAAAPAPGSSPFGGSQLSGRSRGLTPTGAGHPHARRRSWNTQPSKVVLPQRVGDVYLYSQPGGSCSSPCPSPAGLCPSPSAHTMCPSPSLSLCSQGSLLAPSQGGELYDVPRPAVPINYDTPRNWARAPSVTSSGCVQDNRKDNPNDWYDVPRVCHQQVSALLPHSQLTPSSSASSLTIDSLSSSNRSSLATMSEYDVPRSRSMLPSIQQTCPAVCQTYDVPVQQPKELPLEWSEALDMLEGLQNETTAAITRLLGFVRPGWRTPSALSPQLLDVRLSALRLRAPLHDLADFTDGALANAAKANDKGLAAKLRPLAKALRDADRLVNQVITNLDCLNWSITQLGRPEESDDITAVSSPSDALDQLISCARSLTEDVRQTASFIQGNSTLLFNKANKLKGIGDWGDEYDYVKLESRERVDKKHAEIRESLPTDLKKSFDNVIKDADNCTKLKPFNMGPNDKQLVTYYATQTVTYLTYLTNAIDAFLKTVERNQPPSVFLEHGKFVVLSVHRLVYIGDTVHRNVENADVKSKVINYSNALSDGLTLTVTKTKNAADQYPSVTAVQDMVDSVVDISHLARDLKLCMIQAASQP